MVSPTPQVATEPGSISFGNIALLAVQAEQSAALRDQLLAQIVKITSADLAATWAKEGLAGKNTLVAEDAKLVEHAFESRLSELSASKTADPFNDAVSKTTGAQQVPKSDSGEDDSADGIDKSVLAVPVPRRHRNREHLRYVAKQPCLVCGRKPSDPHHLRFAQPRALGRKVSDEFAVPLCRGHHRVVHRSRDERAWWRQIGIEPLKIARKLWTVTRGIRNGPGN